MKRYLITSPAYKGYAEVWYNFEGILCFVNLNYCIMDYKQVKYLFQHLSPDVNQVMAIKEGTSLLIKEEPFEITVDDFKREYPYSRNFHLLDSFWPSMSKRHQALAYFAAIQYRQYCKANESWYKPKIAYSWLHKREYLNDWRKM